MKIDEADLARVVKKATERSGQLFRDLAENTKDAAGITRTSYGAGEEYAHKLIAKTARDLGLESHEDAARNTYVTLPGRDRTQPAWLIGSHMDSVLRGGNYDGAAGVVAGLAAVEALKSLDVQCQRDITVMAIRAEEAAWFIGRHGGHLGSRMALGLLNPTELDTAVRSDSGRTLGEHMSELGCNVEAIRRKQPSLTPARIHGYLELHIEQGPVLEERGFPIGVVTAIRGNSRLRDARCVGRYNHGGGTPQEHRKDAVLATAELITRVEDEWRRLHSAGRDLTFTFGKTFTDAKMHSMSKVPGEVRFTLDLRSGEPDTLGHMRGFVQRCAESIGERRGLKFELGAFSVTEPAVMDPALRRAMISGCQTLEIPYRELASGGGHDAQEFSSVGIPTAMIFIRNANGSHVAEESMEMPDFTLGTTLMTWMLCSEKGGER